MYIKIIENTSCINNIYFLFVGLFFVNYINKKKICFIITFLLHNTFNISNVKQHFRRLSQTKIVFCNFVLNNLQDDLHMQQQGQSF